MRTGHSAITLSFLSLIPFVGCSAATVEDGGPSDEQAIQGGRADASDPAVGLVWIQGGGFCSGTLIEPQLVLTAAHCAAVPIEGFYTGEGKPTTTVATTPPAGFVRHGIDAQIAHPSYQGGNWCPDPGVDVGLVHLARAITNIRPRTLAKAPPRVDESCRTVGFGMHDNQGTTTYEQRRSATETVTAVEATAIEVERGSGVVDHGDSGGPLLCGTQIVGVTSCGNDGSGPTHTMAFHARTDEVRDWIQQTLAGW